MIKEVFHYTVLINNLFSPITALHLSFWLQQYRNQLNKPTCNLLNPSHSESSTISKKTSIIASTNLQDKLSPLPKQAKPRQSSTLSSLVLTMKPGHDAPISTPSISTRETLPKPSKTIYRLTIPSLLKKAFMPSTLQHTALNPFSPDFHKNETLLKPHSCKKNFKQTASFKTIFKRHALAIKAKKLKHCKTIQWHCQNYKNEILNLALSRFEKVYPLILKSTLQFWTNSEILSLIQTTLSFPTNQNLTQKIFHLPLPSTGSQSLQVIYRSRKVEWTGKSFKPNWGNTVKLKNQNLL